MRVNASKTAKTFGRSTRASEIRHLDLLRIPNHDVLDLAFAIDEHTDLTSGLERDLRHLSREFL